MTKRARQLCEKIKSKVKQSAVVGADETGINITGVLRWLWVWQTEAASYFKPHAKRGGKAIEGIFGAGLPEITFATDRHGAYFRMNVKNHQVYLTHLQRNLICLTEI